MGKDSGTGVENEVWDRERRRLRYRTKKRRKSRDTNILTDGPYAVGHLLRRCLRPVCLVGQDPPPVGARHRQHHPPLRRPHQRCPLRLLLRRQPPDRLRFPRPHNQAVEHPRRLQVHHHRQGPLRVGVVRALQPQPPEPRHRLQLLGQAGQSTLSTVLSPPLRECHSLFLYFLAPLSVSSLHMMFCNF